MPLFRPEDEEKFRELFDALERPVQLVVALGPEETPLHGARDVDFGGETVRVVEELCALSSSLSCRVEEEPAGVHGSRPSSSAPTVRTSASATTGRRGATSSARSSARCSRPAPEPSLRPESLELLAGLDRDLAIDVFVTPT